MKLQNGPLILVITVLFAAPAAISAYFYHLTKNPIFQPLGITKERLSQYGGDADGVEILTEIRWGDGQGSPPARQALAQAITNTFAAFGAETRIRHDRNDDRPDTTVSFRIGASFLGPYPAAEASLGIHPAINVFDMYREKERQTRAAAQTRGQ
ncbi:hypothetical protein [Actibacterium sp. D379-3]